MNDDTTSTSYARAAAAACLAADAARAEILPRFRRVHVETKADGSPVTEADRAAERAIREVLRAEYDVPVVGEELGGRLPASGEFWFVDPIDGTISFSRGLPLFGTLIALVHDGEPVLGLIDCAAFDERTLGYRGGGVTRNGVAVHASTRTEFGDALVAHGDRVCFDLFGAQRGLHTLREEACPHVRTYTDAFAHAQVVAGAIDLMVDVYLNPWDMAVAQVLVPEAGGACRTLPTGAHGKAGLILGSPALVEVATGWF